MGSKKLGSIYLMMRMLPFLDLESIQVSLILLMTIAWLTCAGTVPPSPSAQATSTAPTEQIITPATNPSETLPNITANANAAKAQLVQNQMMAFRAIQARAAEAGKPLNPQAMAQLMQAMKSGTLDINSPGLQQIKSLLSLQQQQRQGQVSMNPGAAAAAQVQAQTMSQGQGQGGGSNTDQLLMAAMRQQQMLQQQQNQSQAQVNMVQQNSQQQQSQQQQQQQRMQSQPQTQTSQQPTQSRGQHHLWSGNLIWNPNPSTKRQSIMKTQCKELTSSDTES
jgi:hypothetical protein